MDSGTGSAQSKESMVPHRLFGNQAAKFGEDLLAAEGLAQIGNIGIPLFARSGSSARGELGEDAAHLFAASELDGL